MDRDKLNLARTFSHKSTLANFTAISLICKLCSITMSILFNKSNDPSLFLPLAAETLKPNTSAAASDSMDSSDHPQDGFFLVAHTLAQLGIKFMFGVVGIPVTQLASAAQACGIRFIGCRNEQAAGYAASAVGFLTGTPAVLLTVSGPGVVHGLAGLSNAKINCWPLLMLSGSCETSEIGKGAFQELDQVETVHSYVKLALKPQSLEDIPTALLRGFQATTKGRPGAAYIDLPSDILMRDVGQAGLGAVLQTVSDSIHAEPASTHGVQVSEAELMVASELISSAKRPLIIIGKGAAYSKAELSMRMLIDACKIPFLSTSMGRGTVPDDHPLCVNAARSMALSQADVAVIFGARLNWQLHFGEPPKWSSSVKFILIDPEPCDRDASCAAAVLRADAGATASRLTTHCTVNCEEWLNNLQAKALAASSKLELRLEHTAHPLDYSTVLRILRNAIRELKGPAPIVVAEGANTMDQARLILGPVREPRCRLDAGTWGTMGVGPGYAIAAAVACPERQIIALEGDSAFGFSAMEIETACRYSLPILFIVMNNGGIYGGDRRTAKLQALASKGLSSIGHPYDPAPTAFVADAKYYLLAEAFGGIGVRVDDAPSFQRALLKALDSRKTTIIDVVIDPMAGVESGNVHAFNAPKPTQS